MERACVVALRSSIIFSRKLDCALRSSHEREAFGADRLNSAAIQRHVGVGVSWDWTRD